ncbi:MAG: hypothetical protein BWK75_03270, partial [Candidatus Altiarchaeales archaeon A3]
MSGILILDTIRNFSSLIYLVEDLSITEREGIVMIKSKMILTDGSSLRVSEVWIDNTLEKYSYYWFDEENKLLIGWDNAPHWETTKTFPHHKHVNRKDNV